MLPINWNPGARELRSFARIWFPLFVAAIGVMIWWRGGSLSGAMIAWGVGGSMAVLALASHSIARYVFVGLLVVTYPIGLVVSTVALAILFYLVFTPLGVGMRLFGRDPLRLKERNAASQWTPYQQVDDPDRAFRQY
jgi:hypothetical protein